jgi:TerC family integral membrane protein
METVWLWIGFNVLVLGLLALDLGVFHRKAHVVSLREASIWSAIWVSLALAFGVAVFWWRGTEAGLQFLTGYLIEYSLSIDNIFVFVLIFTYFAVPPIYKHRVLFWGILGALIMRGIMIAAGAALIKVSARRAKLVHADHELVAGTPATFTILPDAVAVVVGPAAPGLADPPPPPVGRADDVSTLG